MKKIVLLSSFLVAIFLGYNNCGVKNSLGFSPDLGTEIGNPMSGTPTISTNPIINPPPVNQVVVESTAVLDTACSVLVECNPSLTMAACEAGLLTAPHVPSALGLAGTSYSTLAQVQQAESSGALKADQSALSACDSFLASLTCNDLNVIASYNSNEPNDFSNAVKIFLSGSGSCSNLF